MRVVGVARDTIPDLYGKGLPTTPPLAIQNATVQATAAPARPVIDADTVGTGLASQVPGNSGVVPAIIPEPTTTTRYATPAESRRASTVDSDVLGSLADAFPEATPQQLANATADTIAELYSRRSSSSGSSRRSSESYESSTSSRRSSQPENMISSYMNAWLNQYFENGIEDGSGPNNIETTGISSGSSSSAGSMTANEDVLTGNAFWNAINRERRTSEPTPVVPMVQGPATLPLTDIPVSETIVHYNPLTRMHEVASAATGHVLGVLEASGRGGYRIIMFTYRNRGYIGTGLYTLGQVGSVGAMGYGTYHVLRYVGEAALATAGAVAVPTMYAAAAGAILYAGNALIGGDAPPGYVAPQRPEYDDDEAPPGYVAPQRDQRRPRRNSMQMLIDENRARAAQNRDDGVADLTAQFENVRITRSQTRNYRQR